MKTLKAKCKICGEVEIPSHFEGYDGEISVPVAFAKTLKDLDKWYKKEMGASYEKTTGNKIKDSFEKTFIEPSHESFDDVGFEEAKKHLLEPILVWSEII